MQRSLAATWLMVGLIAGACSRDESIDAAIANDSRFQLIDRAQDVPVYPPARENWEDVSRWPSGTTLAADGGDYTWPIDAAQHKRADEGLQATYVGTVSPEPGPYGAVNMILGAWRADGTLAELSCRLVEGGHFGYHYYRSGRLWAFHRYDTVKELHEYFDEGGAILGYSMNFFKKDRPNHSRYVWRGRSVDVRTFHQLRAAASPMRGAPVGG